MKIHLSKWQTKVIEDAHRYIVINCGRRAGKTFLVSLKLLEKAKEPNQIIWYVAPDYTQAESIMWQMLKELIPPHAVTYMNNSKLIIQLKNGSQILLKGARDPDKLRGVRIDFCVFDETAFFDKWDEAWKVIRPTLIDSVADCWFISTPNGLNHFKELADLCERDSDYSYHHFTSYDNPFLDKAELDKVKEDMDEDSFAQEIMGEFRKMKGLIFKRFERDIHMVDIPDLTGFTFYRSLDFGYGHKAALGYFAVNPDQTAIYCYDGLYRNELDTEQLSDNIKLKDGTRFITGAWADSAQPQIIQDLNLKGVHFEPVAKGPDSVLKGIANVAELLKVRKDTGKPTLMFSKELPWIADEFERYRWVETKNENSAQRQMPLKRDDDAMDMVRYFCMSYNKQPEEDENVTTGNITGLWGSV